MCGKCNFGKHRPWSSVSEQSEKRASDKGTSQAVGGDARMNERPAKIGTLN